MLKLVIIFFLFFIFAEAASQTSVSEKIKANIKNEDQISLLLIAKENTNTLTDASKQNAFIKSEADFYAYTRSISTLQTNKEEKPSFNIVSSLRGNIRWGGFWENYAIINFTPDMFIQPFDFISIYANQNTSNYIPVTLIKQGLKPLVTPIIMRGIAVLAIDNSVKFLLPKNKILQQVAGFALKNLAINLLKSSSQNMMEFQNYYCSVNIRFNYTSAFSLLH